MRSPLPSAPPSLLDTTRGKVACLLAAKCCVLLSAGAFPMPVAAWLSGVFALRFARSMGPVAGFFALALLNVPVQYAAWGFFPFGGAVGLVVFAVITSLIGTLPVLADRLLSDRLTGVLRTLPFPCAAAALEFFGSSGELGSWGSTAYSQVDSLSLLQFTSVAGLAGLNFLLPWVGSAANSLWESPKDLRGGARAALPALAVLAIVLGLGQLRLARAPMTTDLVQVTAIGAPEVRIFPDGAARRSWASGDALGTEELAAFRALHQPRAEAIIVAASAAAAGGSKLVTWGEGALVVLDQDLNVLVRRLAALAIDGHTAIAAAVVVVPTDDGERRWDNKVLFLNDDGTTAWEFRKAHPTPGAESRFSLRGDGDLKAASVDGARVGAAICYDLDFPTLVARASELDLGIIVAPAGDWPDVARIHAEMARVRALEQGVSIVRPTSGGVTIAFDPYGRTIGSVSTVDDAVRSITLWVPKSRVPTLYAWVGDVVGQVAGLGLLLLIGLRIKRRAR